MKHIIVSCILMVFSFSVAAKKNRKERIIYEYKKYEKFDMDEITVEGEGGIPGDIGVDPRYKKKFSNRLPYRRNFNKEIRKSIYRIR